jgi:superoxide reductase
MTQRDDVYKCEQCGNIVTVMHAGNGTLICCGEEMKLLQENTTEVGVEKHVPVIERKGTTVTVRVGSVAHPMEEKHYIEVIGVLVEGDKLYRAYLKPGDKPEAVFEISGNVICARAYCNIHGMWKSA